MPYVPSKKTDGKSTDRELIDAAVEKVAREAAEETDNNLSIVEIYRRYFLSIIDGISDSDATSNSDSVTIQLGKVIRKIGEGYGYEGAFLGELNYAITRFIQRVPQIMVESKKWEAKDEIRYWLYAATIEALITTSQIIASRSMRTLEEMGIAGVFEDIKDEYKRRVNTSYEVVQISKSGDCYDTPYYTRAIEVADENGKVVGHMEVMLKRSEETLHKDILDGQLVIKRKPSGGKGPGI